MYYVYAWKNTGFNAVNLPDKPSRLSLENALRFDAIDTIQNTCIETITIRATFDQAIGIDYVALRPDNVGDAYPGGATFFTVQGVNMTSKDVAVLSVLEDFITTCGGVESLLFDGGIIERKSVSQNDVAGSWQSIGPEDPYIQISDEPFVLANYFSMKDISKCHEPDITQPNSNKLPVGGSSEPYQTETSEVWNEKEDVLIETSISLDGYKGKISSTYSHGGQQVQVGYDQPDIEAAPPAEFYINDTYAGTFSDADVHVYKLPNSTGCGLEWYKRATLSTDDAHSISITEGLAYLRARGLDTAIVASYVIPDLMISSSGNHYTSAAGPATLHKSSYHSSFEETTNYYFIDGTATHGELGGNFRFDLSDYYGSVALNQSGYNNVITRMFTEPCFKYGILTCAGNRYEANPRQLIYRSVGDSFMVNAFPSISIWVDPRSTGRPYYAFTWVNGLKTTLFNGAVAGAQWRQVPMVFRGASGSEIIQQQYDLRASRREAEFGIQAMQANFAERNAELQAEMASNPALRYSRLLGGVGGGAGLNYNFSHMNTSNEYYSGPGNSSSVLSVNPLGVIGMAANAMNAGMMNAYNEHGANLELARAQTYATSLEAVQRAQRDEELYSLGVQLNNVVPEIRFGGDINTLRDFYQNGILVYRYIPTVNDVQRFMVILNNFGIKVNIPLNAKGSQIRYVNNENTKVKFDYLQIAGAQIGFTDGRTSLYRRNGIAKQLSTGVRFWHQSDAFPRGGN